MLRAAGGAKLRKTGHAHDPCERPAGAAQDAGSTARDSRRLHEQPLYFFNDDANRELAAKSTGMYAWTERPGERIALAWAAPGFRRVPQQGADSVTRIAGHGRADFGRIEIQAPEGSNQTFRQCTGLQMAKRLQHYQPASLSVQASSPALSYLSGHSYPASRRAIRSQLRCDHDSRSDVHTLLFHRISNLVRPMDTPPCRMLFLFLHTLWVMPIAKQLYIQNEGLIDIFCRNAEFHPIPVLVDVSIGWLACIFAASQLIRPRLAPLCRICLLFRLVITLGPRVLALK